MDQYTHDGLEREYTLYKPSGLKDNSPLVVFLHWYSGTGEDIINYVNFNKLADKYRFGILYPEGLLDKYKVKHWNANLEISDVNDIHFITKLTTFIQEKHVFSKINTFVTGISNGGFMCYTLALSKPYFFRAYAPVIGLMSLYDWDNRTFKNPVSLLHICGLDDEVVPQDGTGKEGDGWGGAPHIDVIMDYWRSVNKSKEIRHVQFTPKSTIDYYIDGINDTELWCVKIKDHGHDFPLKEHGIDGAELIWSFFKKFLK